MLCKCLPFNLNREGLRQKTYTINCIPLPWQRAGLNKMRFFDRQQADKISYGLLLQRQHDKEPLFKGPLHIDIIFYLTLPKMAQARRRALAEKYHYTVPDKDNFIKFLQDAAKNILFTDDRQICSSKELKIYDENPRTEFTIIELL